MTSPMYRRIAEDLREDIESGGLRPGEQLPTEQQLSTKYAASRNTVRDAVRWLINRGLVETRPGQGTFVNETVDPFITTLSADPETGLGGGEGLAALTEVTASGRTAEASIPLVGVQKASRTVATRLGIAEGAQVVSRTQHRYIDGLPWSIQTSYYPMDFVLRGAGRLLEAGAVEGGTVQYLAETLGLNQIGYRDLLLVRAPNEAEARFFELPDDGRVAVVVIWRTAFAGPPDDPAPFRVTVSAFPADRNRFAIDSGSVPTPVAPGP
jgi:GntR family transcriptional regulator